MWIFTVFGFFSVVDAGKGNVQVRARRAAHLQNLLHHLGNELPWSQVKIIKNDEADYRYRFIVSADAWAWAVAQLAKMASRVSNFKSDTGRESGRVDPGYCDALHEVWGVMHRYQGDVESNERRAKEVARG